VRRGGVICHQRIVRERLAAAYPRPVLVSLSGCTVEPISRREAAAFIVTYEWLGNCGKPILCVGARDPDGNLFGVTCFGNGVGDDVRRRLGGETAVCLERGACAHWAHQHASSWLISRSCRLASRHRGWQVFYAYSDPNAGEIGTVYQACNWLYLGQGLGHGSNGRAARVRHAIRPPWVALGDVRHYSSTRILRHRSGAARDWRTYEDVKNAGGSIEKVPARHLYAHHIGGRRARTQWLAEIAPWAPLSYPKREELRQQIDAGLADPEAGRVYEGEAVFDELLGRG
jgi:hypothetical protein